MNFLTFFNLILIGLLVGVAAALETNSMMLVIYLGVMSVVLFFSYIFKTIAVLRSVNEFLYTTN
jgi:hypothetical protein